MRTIRRKPAKRVEPPRDMRLVVWSAGPNEDLSIYECNLAEQYHRDQLANGRIRLFDAATDDRGPEVPFIATWGNELKTWHPQTSGTYIVTFNCRKEDRPESVRSWQLGFGDSSSPQHTRAAIHRVYLDIIDRTPELKPYLAVYKVPCVFRKDSESHPGGSFVEIDIATLPEPAPRNSLTRFYG